MTHVSVIIPVFNAESTLFRCLKNLQCNEIDAEFICVDDGSTDGSLELCNYFASLDPRFRIVSQKNSGPAAARNKGIDLANGEYVCFVDSDDYMEKGSLDLLYGTAKSGQYDLVIHGAYTSDDASAPKWIMKTINTQDIEFTDAPFSEIFNLPGSRPFLWLHFIKKSVIDEHNIRMCETSFIGEDQAFIIKYLSKCQRVKFIHNKAYHYNIGNPGSIMTYYYSRPVDKMYQHVGIIQDVTNSLSQELTDPVDQATMAGWIIDLMYWDLASLLYRDQHPISTEVLNCLSKWMNEKSVKKMSRRDLFRYEQIKAVNEGYEQPDASIAKLKKLRDDAKEEVLRIEKAPTYIFLRKMYTKFPVLKK